MKHHKFLLLFLIVPALILLSCLSEDSGDGPFGTGSSSDLSFENVQANHQKPSKVQYIFSLRDRDDHAVLIPQTDFDENVEIIIEEDDVPIDYSESHGFVHTAESFGMDLVLVLDYTASMAQNNGIDTMVQGVDLILDNIAESHRVAVVEFHDNNPADNFSVLQEFTSNKTEASQTVQSFNNVYNGFSTCWDAVYRGLELFPEDSNANTFRALFFLSDGFDNSSSHSPEDIIELARSIGVSVYNIGVGENLNSTNEGKLKNISSRTGGKYYKAENLGILQDRFLDVVDDLGGNYKISYITPKRNTFDVKIWLTYHGKTTDNPIVDTVNGAAIFDSDRNGILSLNQPVKHGSKADVFISADHTPREVSTFKFKLDLPDPVTLDGPIVNIPVGEGGLLNETWNAVANDLEWYTTSGDELSFGDFGLLFKFTLDNLPDTGVTIPLIFDNSVYSNNIKFYGGDLSELNGEGNWETEIDIE